MRIERLSIGEDYDAMKLYRPAGLRTADPKRPDWTRDHGYAQTSEFPFPDLYLHESVADLAETDPAFPAFLEECLENFTCHGGRSTWRFSTTRGSSTGWRRPPGTWPWPSRRRNGRQPSERP